MELTQRQQQIADDIAAAQKQHADGLITKNEMKRKIAEIKRQAFHSFASDLPKLD